VELQIGNLTSRLEDACAPDQFDVSRTPYTTLIGKDNIYVFFSSFFIGHMNGRNGYKARNKRLRILCWTRKLSLSFFTMWMGASASFNDFYFAFIITCLCAYDVKIAKRYEEWAMTGDV
jgi:hypothetical protein